jgi:hypothetical protein
MTAAPSGPDWWQASDGKWYPPPRPEAPAAAAGTGPPGTGPSGTERPGTGPAGTEPAAAGPPGAPPPGAPPRTPVNLTPVIVAVGVLLTAVAIGVAIARLGDDDRERADPPPTTDDAPPAVTDPDDQTTVTSPDTSPSTSEGTTVTTEAGGIGIEGLTVADSGFSTYAGFDGQAGSYGVILENTTSDPITNFAVEVVVYDTSDAVVTSEPHTVAVIGPGARLGLGAEIADTVPNGIGRLDVRVEEGSGGPVPDGAFTISDVSTTSDQFGIYTTFVVSSSYDTELELPYAYAIYRDAAGRIIGGANSFVDLVPSRGRANGEVTSFTVVPNVAGAEVYVDPGFF